MDWISLSSQVAVLQWLQPLEAIAWWIVNLILSQLIVLAVSGAFAYKIFFKPNLELETNAQVKEGVIWLTLNIKNKKDFMTFGKNEVYLTIFFPIKLAESITSLERNSPDGQAWSSATNSWEKATILDQPYLCMKCDNSHPVFPMRSSTVLRLSVPLEKHSSKYRLYYNFSTKYGRVPKNASLERVRKGDSPSVLIEIPSSNV